MDETEQKPVIDQNDRIQMLIDKFEKKYGRKPQTILISTDLLKQMGIIENFNMKTISNLSCKICGLQVKALNASKDCIEVV